nr:hypothetical protein BCU57_00840 [Shewanella sp. 10N.286.48.B5]
MEGYRSGISIKSQHIAGQNILALLCCSDYLNFGLFIDLVFNLVLFKPPQYMSHFRHYKLWFIC